MAYIPRIESSWNMSLCLWFQYNYNVKLVVIFYNQSDHHWLRDVLQDHLRWNVISNLFETCFKLIFILEMKCYSGENRKKLCLWLYTSMNNGWIFLLQLYFVLHIFMHIYIRTGWTFRRRNYILSYMSSYHYKTWNHSLLLCLL